MGIWEKTHTSYYFIAFIQFLVYVNIKNDKKLIGERLRANLRAIDGFETKSLADI